MEDKESDSGRSHIANDHRLKCYMKKIKTNCIIFNYLFYIHSNPNDPATEPKSQIQTFELTQNKEANGGACSECFRTTLTEISVKQMFSAESQMISWASGMARSSS